MNAPSSQLKTSEPLTRENLHGVWAATILPWDENDRLDATRYVQEIRAYGNTGIHGIYTGGTTGEFYAQDDRTFQQVTDIACSEGHALGVPVQIGCSALSTRTVVERVRYAVAAGANGVQIALPFWLELADDEVTSFLHAAADAAGACGLIYYQTMRAKRRVDAALLGRLVTEIPTLVGMKDTGCSIDELSRVVAAAPGLAVFGAEHDLIERTRAGGRGIYSAITGLCARRVAHFYNLCATGKFEEAASFQEMFRRYTFELLVPIVREGLWDSAVDRVQRVAGGVDVGLRCQAPYRSATPEHVARLMAWCREHAPQLLER